VNGINFVLWTGNASLASLTDVPPRQGRIRFDAMQMHIAFFFASSAVAVAREVQGSILLRSIS
jgi:hypothetical protein